MGNTLSKERPKMSKNTTNDILKSFYKNEFIHNSFFEDDIEMNFGISQENVIIDNSNMIIPSIDNNIIINNINDFWEANSESDDDEEQEDLDLNEHTHHSKLSFDRLKHKIYRNFDLNLINKYSSALDILASYIKYHVIIYTEASYYCHFKLNMFMLPCIFLSTLCSVLTSLQYGNAHMILLVSSLNGLVAFLLAIINYLKLDASAEAHKISAYQYSKLKNYIEFSSGEILLFQEPIIENRNFINEQMILWNKNNSFLYKDEDELKKEKTKKTKELQEEKNTLEKKIIESLQNKIIEIKKTLKNIEDNNNFILPKHINHQYYNICNINVFSYIKGVENYKLVLLNELRNIKNEIRFYKIKKQSLAPKEISRITKLYLKKNNLLKEFLELNKGSSLIDAMFQQEIVNINIYKNYWYVFYLQNIINAIQNCCCFCFTINTCSILPKNYKKCTQVGFKDDEGVYLLDKILHL